MQNLFKYIYKCGGASTRARSRVVWQWLVIPEASLIGPEKINDMFVRSRTARAMNVSRMNLRHSTSTAQFDLKTIQMQNIYRRSIPRNL